MTVKVIGAGLAGSEAACQLARRGISVELYETRGTMHGFDIVRAAPTTQAAVARRIDFMRQAFRKAEG